MDHQPIADQEGQGRDDRISKLGDGVLGHILSFLGTKEAARAAVLSSRWRDVFASVHTVCMEEPEAPIPDYDDYGGRRREPDPAPPFTALVNAALFARSRRPGHATASPPLRALRVAMESYNGVDAFTVDQWVTYAIKHAAAELKLELSMRQVPICSRPDPYRVAVAGSDEEDDGGKNPVDPEDDVDEEDDVASSVDEMPCPWWSRPPAVYTVPRQVFACAALRSLRLGSCRLSPPEAVRLPSLEVLGLTHVPDEEEHVQRLISSCPRLADLTLEACATVTMLSLLDNRCLRRLAVVCCHKLATVTVDASELHSFEYRGAVPSNSFLTVRGGGDCLPSIRSCKVDICAVCLDKEATSSEQLAALGSFLQPFTSTTRRLQLCAARMGSSFVALPAFRALRHLQLDGRVLQGDADPVAVTCTILRQTPDLELLTLFFETAPAESPRRNAPHYTRDRKEIELVNTHHLHYNKYDSIDHSPAASAPPVPPCLRSKVRRINLSCYQGGRAQRTLARFLLLNAPVLDMLYCEFAYGTLWIQTELILEMEGWVVNEKARKVFY